MAIFSSLKKLGTDKPIIFSLKEYIRGIVGGLLFSFPLLYTMEMWWAGYMAQPYHLLLLFIFTYCLLIGYNRYSGMHPGVSWTSVFIDSIEEMGFGIVLSFLILIMLNQIPFDTSSMNEILGKVLIEAMVISIGVSIGTAQLEGKSPTNGDDKNDDEKGDDISEAEKKGVVRRSGRMAMVVLALCGSIVVGGNVAPTEEILVLAISSTPNHLIIMVCVSLILSLAVTYFIDFKGTKHKAKNTTVFKIIFDTSLSYIVALIASAFILWYFGKFANTGFYIIFAQIIVLGVISSLGASAGRLLIK